MLKKIKQMLGLSEDDKSMDAQLSWILSATQSRLRVLLGGIDPKDELNYIIMEVLLPDITVLVQKGFLLTQ